MKETEIVSDYPPNIGEIRYYLNPPEWSIFAYGDTIYAPNQEKLYPDVVAHEEFHLKRQKKYTHPDIWWKYYLTDSAFRLEEELLAYAEQYKWLKKEGLREKDLKQALTEMSINLITWYNVDISLGVVESKIKQYAKIKREKV